MSSEWLVVSSNHLHDDHQGYYYLLLLTTAYYCLLLLTTTYHLLLLTYYCTTNIRGRARAGWYLPRDARRRVLTGALRSVLTAPRCCLSLGRAGLPRRLCRVRHRTRSRAK